MVITISKEVTEETIQKLTNRAVHVLFIVQGLTEKKRLFNGSYDTVEVEKSGDDLAVTFKQKGKPGFLKKTFKAGFVRAISHDWMNDPMLNRSGLAAKIWSDNTPNKLRRRLEQKTNHIRWVKIEFFKPKIDVPVNLRLCKPGIIHHLGLFPLGQPAFPGFRF